ncbi:MAG: hypothetical protein NT010_16980 [Proteobacteria bacterium]|nr:hypothetical protein [Pseudomonadota bacterium]
MKKTIEVAVVLFVLTLFAGSAFGYVTYVPSNYLVQFDDAEPGLTIITYKDGQEIQRLPFENEHYVGGYGLWHGAFTSNVSIKTNIYEPNGRTLSDTWEISGVANQNTVMIAFFSDTEGGPGLTPLQYGYPIDETGDWQTVGYFSVSNGDTYTWQFRSDVSEVPLPATILLFAPGLAGLAAIRRRFTK